VFSGGGELLNLLAQQGFLEVRRRGRHVVMQKKTPDGTTTVVIPDHPEIRIGTLLSIIRQSRLARGLFEG